MDIGNQSWRTADLLAVQGKHCRTCSMDMQLHKVRLKYEMMKICLLIVRCDLIALCI
jgi:hypothetical protein